MDAFVGSIAKAREPMSSSWQLYLPPENSGKGGKNRAGIEAFMGSIGSHRLPPSGGSMSELHLTQEGTPRYVVDDRDRLTRAAEACFGEVHAPLMRALERSRKCLRKCLPLFAEEDVQFPMYVLPMATFLTLKEMRPHEDLLREGLLVDLKELPSGHGHVNFISHEWLSAAHPDPTAEQLTLIQNIFRKCIEGDLPFRSEKEWETYSETFSLQYGETKVTHDKWLKTVREGYVWLDFASIPQHSKTTQALAVASMPQYVERSCNFWVMCPPCTHTESQTLCDYNSWRARAWCRVEDWLNEMSSTSRRPIIAEGKGDVWVEEFSDKMVPSTHAHACVCFVRMPMHMQAYCTCAIPRLHLRLCP